MNFKLLPSSRKNIKLIEPNKLKSWVIHFFSEILSTLIISFLFAGLFIVLPNGKIILYYFYTSILTSLYSGFIVIGILLIFFMRWSADANPIISIYKSIIGLETYRYCLFKIFAQIIGGILAGLLVMLCTQSTKGTAWNIFNGGTATLHGFFQQHHFSAFGGFIFPLFIEIIVGTMLLWSLFSSSFTNKYRLLLVLLVTTFATLVGSTAQIMNFNAVRAIAQDVGAIINGQMSKDMWITISGILVGTLLTPFLLVIMQWLFSKYINVWFNKLINLKKFIKIDSKDLDKENNSNN